MRSHDMCQSYQEYHSCLFNHMGDYDSLCAIVTTKNAHPSGQAHICVGAAGKLAALII